MGDVQEPEVAKAPVFYANGVSFVVQLYDFRLDFTLATERATPPTVVASVHLSPHLAKAVGRLLRLNVKAYETQSGQPIHLPDATLQQLNIEGLEE